MKIRVYQADKGDCLRIIGQAGGNILVDGGMRSAFMEHVQPDLGSMARRREVLDLVYVSHIDSDHIAGVLELLDVTMAWRVFDYRKSSGNAAKEPAAPRMPQVREIWHNAFSMLLKDNTGAVEQLLAQSGALLSMSSDVDVLALAVQHRELAYSVEEAIRVSRRIAAEQLSIPLNAQFDGQLIMVRTPSGREARIGKMDVYVIGPFAEDLSNLMTEWDKWLREHKERLAKLRAKAASDADAIGNAGVGVSAALDIALKDLGDRTKVTAPNLASLMLLVEEDGKTVLLTGDGHADDILAGLESQGRLDAQGNVHVDVLKVQHHGSEHNITEEFCRRVGADQYIFCGNGKHENPDLDALDMLLRVQRENRPGQKVKLWFNCASAQAPSGTPRQHMRAVEKLVAKHAGAAGSRIAARFLTGSSFDVTV